MNRKSRNILKPSAALLQWQKNMLRLVAKYSSRVRDEQNGILHYSWNIGYLDVNQYLLQRELELQYQEFVCQTNNIIFAAMIFEAHILSEEGRLVTVASIDFNNLIQ